MQKNKLIPCRVCGKLFEPCATCQAHNDIFRWRNFACSKECAEKYISETITYRNSLKQSRNCDSIESVSEVGNTVENNNTTKKRNYRKKSADNVETINEEREQID